MKQGCYTIDELMDLTGNEKHLKDCETCNELYQDWCGFKETMRAEGAMAGDFLRLFRQRREAAALVEKIRLNRSEESFNAVLPEQCLYPEMVVELCKQAHHTIYVNPNEAAQLLDLAKTVLEKINKERYSPEKLSWAEARYYVNVAGLNIVRGYPAQAEAAYRKAAELFKIVEDDFQTAIIVRGLLFALAMQGRRKEAVRVALDAFPTLREYGSISGYNLLMNNVALVYLGMGRGHRARTILLCLLGRMSENDEDYNLVLYNYALVHMEKGNYSQSIRWLFDAISLCGQQGKEYEKARSLILLGEIQLMLGELDHAEAHLEASKDIMQKYECMMDVAQINVYLARLSLARNRPEESLPYLQEAIDFFSAQGVQPELVAALQYWEKAHLDESEDLHEVAGMAFAKMKNFQRLSA